MRGNLAIATAILAAGAALAETASYEVAEVRDGGSIAGRVSFAGTPGAPEMLPVTTDRHACGTEKPSRALVVGAAGGLGNAVVFLRDIRRGKDWAPEEFALGQTDCRFEPHILLLPEEADLRLLNDDRIAHNVRSYGEDSVFNVGQPKFVEKLLIENFTKQVADRSVIRVGCDLHPWMQAFVIVQKHPYYARTDENGFFALEDVPPGKYELALWHETLGTQERKVSVGPNEETTVTFTMGD